MDKQVLCYGEVLWDTLPDGKKPGGAPMNVAGHLIQQGIAAVLASRVGTDQNGEDLCAFLSSVGLYNELIQRDPILPTCVVGVELDSDQQATYTIPYPVSWDNIQPERNLIEKANQAAVIVYGSLACRDARSLYTLTELLKTDALKIFDVNIRAPHFQMETLKTLGGLADVIKMNQEELDMVAGTELSHLSEEEKILFLSDFLACKTICITRGGAGALIFMEQRFFDHPGYKVDVVDTVGAGDAFLATIIAGLLSSQEPALMLAKACAIGAFVAGSRGANPVYDFKKIKEISSQPKH